MKFCKRCGETKELDGFYRDRAQADGLTFYCKLCCNAKVKKRQESDPERFAAGQRLTSWRWTLKNRYNMTETDYNAMLAAQGGGCALCHKPPGVKKLPVDHDHATGATREILCDDCNKGLGNFHDDPVLLLAAADYLMRHQMIGCGSDQS